ncbi:hypothetical protein BKA23_1517 [Rudaeicoccus suwonensis]|uniref:Uncharacterized protein n=1 Tax=Rudaeicoccus suwonensis TaxID=657409 RepID=A0A561EAR9_9MICO|nr:hypothetical protein BKA23_1517 [Rudaeicoccus suwonensis]
MPESAGAAATGATGSEAADVSGAAGSGLGAVTGVAGSVAAAGTGVTASAAEETGDVAVPELGGVAVSDMKSSFSSLALQ